MSWSGVTTNGHVRSLMWSLSGHTQAAVQKTGHSAEMTRGVPSKHIKQGSRHADNPERGRRTPLKASELLKRHALPFATGVGAGGYLFFGAQQDQMDLASALAPVAVMAGVFTPDGPALPIALNGLAYVTLAVIIRSTWATRRWLSIVLIGSLALYVAWAFDDHISTHRLQPYTEVVLNPGMRLTAETPNGTLTIVAGNGTRRTYHGEGWEKSVLLVARTSRWYKSLGLYDPAESYSPYGRLLAEEGRLHFSTEAEAEGWIRARSLEANVGKERLIFTDDGLVLRYSMRAVPGSGVPTAQVDLWQIYVEGRRPRSLPGADDEAIRIDGGAVAEYSTPHSL